MPPIPPPFRSAIGAMVARPFCIAGVVGCLFAGVAAGQQLPCPAQWSQVTPVFSPSGRTECLLLDAPAMGGVVLFGGARSSPTTLFGDTVVWNGTNWVTVSGSVAPLARRGAAGAYDSTRSRIVLYGGNQSTGVAFNDLWLFNGASWAQVTHSDASLPGQRFRATMVYDSARDRIVMFGGVRSTTPGDTRYRDTWEMNPASIGTSNPLWVQAETSSVTSPANADVFPAVFDSRRGVTLAVSYTSTFNQALGAVHEWNGVAWTQRDTTASLPPRASFGLGYDPVRGHAIVYGGTNGVTGQRYGDTWEFDGADWARTRTELQGPGSTNNTYLRQFVAIAHDTLHNTTVHFSGTTAPVASTPNDTWLYTSVAGPTLGQNPSDLTIDEGLDASLTATVDIPPGSVGAFAWLRNGVPIVDGAAGASAGGGTVTGASGALPGAGTAVPITLTISGVALSDAGAYRLRVTSPCSDASGLNTAAATLVVNDVPVPCPSIAHDPVNASITLGAAAALTASVTVPAGVTGAFAWLRDGVPVVDGAAGASLGGGTVAGATGALPAPPDGTLALTIEGVQLSDAGEYRLRITAVECAPVETEPATLTVTPPPPVLPSDSCALAPIFSEGSYTFSTVDSTTDGPDEPGPCDFAGYVQVDNDVWVRYFPSCTGSATISLCGSSFDTKMVVYRSATCPTEPATAVACSEDDCDFQSTITLPVESMEPLLIRMGGFAGSTGDAMLTISCVANPSCPADFNQDGSLDPDDLADFIGAFFAEPAGAGSDFNGDGVTDPDDLADFIGAFFGGC